MFVETNWVKIWLECVSLFNNMPHCMHFQSKLARNGSTASEDSSTSGLNDVTSNGNSGSDDTTTPLTSSSLQSPRGVSDDEFVLDRSVLMLSVKILSYPSTREPFYFFLHEPEWLRRLEHTLDPRCKSHQCLYKYIDQNGPATNLAAKRSTGVTAEVNLKNRLHTMMHASEGSTLALKPRANVTRSPKHGYL